MVYNQNMFIDHFIPMGATAGDIFHPILKEQDNWLEHKWNGHRCTAVVDESGEIIFLSAVESKKDGVGQGFCTDNTEALPHLVAALHGKLPPKTILDGELVTSTTEPSDSHKVTSLLKPKNGKAVERQSDQGQLIFVVFDIYYYDGNNLCGQTNEYRRQLLENGIFGDELNHNLSGTPSLHLTERYFTGFEELLSEWRANGFEGGVAKRPRALIKTRPMGKSGKSRSSDWIKVKVQKAEYDVVPMGVTWPSPLSLKSGEKVKTPNKFYERGQISGMVFGQYVPDALVDPKAVQKVVDTEYERYEESRAQVIETMRAFKIDGHTLQPMGVFGNFTDELRQWATHNAAEWIGKVVVTINAYHRYEDTGYFQHPNMIGGSPRIDKTPEQCVYTGEREA